MRLLLGITIGFTVLSAQTKQLPVSQPGLGLVFDASTETVRPLRGVPGSATLGEALEPGMKFSRAVASGEGYVIGVDAGTGASFLTNGVETQEMAGVHPGASRIVASPRGRAAAFYFEESGTVQIVAGLPFKPQLVREVYPGGVVSALAISDSGDMLLAAVQESDAEAVILFVNGDLQRLQTATRVLAMQFFTDSSDAMFAESAANAVWLVRNGGAPQVTLLADERDGIEEATAVAASDDGSRVFIAMHSGKVAIRNVAGGEQSMVVCSCQPDGLSRLRGSAVFRLNGIGQGPVWILDASGLKPRIMFVAAAQESGQ